MAQRLDDYLVKPASGDQVRETVRRLLRRDRYDERLRALYALASKRAVLETRMGTAELADSEEYADLLARFEALSEATDRTVDAFEDVDFAATFRDLETRPGSTPTGSSRRR